LQQEEKKEQQKKVVHKRGRSTAADPLSAIKEISPDLRGTKEVGGMN
jgi:hypothetical protein